MLKLLIIDSDRFVREACREAAASLGFSASGTDSIDQALWFLGSQEIDVVLLDWTLAHRAVEVLRQLKHRRPECEIVAVTNNNQVQSAVEAMKAGASTAFPSPSV